jgi:GH18 family chitinase
MLGVVPLATALAFVVASVVNANNTTNTNGPSAMTWYAGWHATDFPLKNMSWEKYDQVFYAFASVRFFTSSSSSSSLKEMVQGNDSGCECTRIAGCRPRSTPRVRLGCPSERAFHLLQTDLTNDTNLLHE